MNGANLSLPEPIELVAIDPARNIRRRYSITASLDLFGMIVVETRWGRIGAHGQAQRHAFADRAAADRHIAATLRRRGTAETRIGVLYEPVAPRFEPLPPRWLLEEIGRCYGQHVAGSSGASSPGRQP